MVCIGYAKSVPDEGSFLIGEAAPSPALVPLVSSGWMGNKTDRMDG